MADKRHTGSTEFLPDRILVAWHPESGDEAIDAAAWLARSTKVKVRAVCTILRLWPATSLSKLGGKYDDWLETETKNYRNAVKKAFEKVGIPRSRWDDDYAVIIDGPSEAGLLDDAARSFNADTIILGSQAAAPKGRFLAGTTTDALLHSSPYPLTLIPREITLSKRGMTRVNVAFLSSEEEASEVALHYGAGLACELGVPLRLVAFSPAGIADVTKATRDLAQKLSDEWSEQALAMLDRARDSVMDQMGDLTVDTALGTGAGWRCAVDALKWKKGDIICLGSSGSGTLERVFLGSTAAQFIQNVSVPVIIHPAIQP